MLAVATMLSYLEYHSMHLIISMAMYQCSTCLQVYLITGKVTERSYTNTSTIYWERGT